MTSTVERTPERARSWHESSSRQAAAALLLYSLICIGFFGLRALPHLGQRCVCGASPDPATYMWYLAWWPHALLHGLNPFVTDAVFAPDRVDLGGVMLVPGAAMAAAPITLLFGPLASFNLLALTSPVLAAFFAFLLCRYITGNFAASLVGGYVFGFSSYMLGHMLGHLNLVLTFPIPAAIHLTLRVMDRRIGRRAFVVLLTLDLTALLLASTELMLTFVLLGGVALAVTFLLAPEMRPTFRDAISLIVWAAALAALITTPFIYYALKGNVSSGFQGVGDLYGGDALGFLVPTPVTRLGRMWFATVSAQFNGGNFSESGIYVGLPLALILARYGITRWRAPTTRILFAMLGVIGVLLLGSHLHIAGHATIPLPWNELQRLPILGQVIPVRLGVYLFLVAAVIVAMWLAKPRAGGWDVAKWALAALTIVFLLPNIGSGRWRSTPSNPPFFATTEYKRFLHHDETVLILPWIGNTESMLWQAETDMWFRMAGGYLGKLFPADYAREPVLPAFFHLNMIDEASNLRAFLDHRDVSAVIVDPTNPQQWPGVLARLGLRPVSLGGVLLYRVTSAKA